MSSYSTFTDTNIYKRTQTLNHYSILVVWTFASVENRTQDLQETKRICYTLGTGVVQTSKKKIGHEHNILETILIQSYKKNTNIKEYITGRYLFFKKENKVTIYKT